MQSNVLYSYAICTVHRVLCSVLYTSEQCTVQCIVYWAGYSVYCTVQCT